jgi:hypothetical protein
MWAELFALFYQRDPTLIVHLWSAVENELFDEAPIPLMIEIIELVILS